MGGLDKLTEQLSKKMCVEIDSHVIDSILALFKTGVLKLYMTRPSCKLSETIMTVKQASGVRFEGREKIIELEEKLSKIKAYCIEHKEYMWAAHIWSVITGEDFRDIGRETNG